MTIITANSENLYTRFLLLHKPNLNIFFFFLFCFLSGLCFLVALKPFSHSSYSFIEDGQFRMNSPFPPHPDHQHHANRSFLHTRFCDLPLPSPIDDDLPTPRQRGDTLVAIPSPQRLLRQGHLDRRPPIHPP